MPSDGLPPMDGSGDAPWTWWTATHDADLVAICREDGLDMPADEIADAARAYMTHGSDGGGNDLGVIGVYIASRCDRIARNR